MFPYKSIWGQHYGWDFGSPLSEGNQTEQINASGHLKGLSISDLLFWEGGGVRWGWVRSRKCHKQNNTIVFGIIQAVLLDI